MLRDDKSGSGAIATSDADGTRDWVKTYYGEVLQKSNDLQTNACCAVAPANWVKELLGNVHPEVQERFYGCGFPLPAALTGKTVVDLGSGTGRDVFCLSQLVAEDGRVIGVDMTQEQLDVAERHLDWHRDRFGFAKSNVELHQGYIEKLHALPIEAGSVDVIVSNCVVNLSPRKDLVLEEIARLLKPGGEFYVSDVVADRRLPEHIATDPVLYGECLGGAMYRHDFEKLAKEKGFNDPRVIEVSPITINNADAEKKAGAARFFSVTYRLFKIAGLEDQCEDYGQLATYKGGIAHMESLFVLDDHHTFEKGRPERVCGNTADMLQKTRFAEFFEIVGTKDTHFGVFDCGETMAAAAYTDAAVDSGSCC